MGISIRQHILSIWYYVLTNLIHMDSAKSAELGIMYNLGHYFYNIIIYFKDINLTYNFIRIPYILKHPILWLRDFGMMTQTKNKKWYSIATSNTQTMLTMTNILHLNSWAWCTIGVGKGLKHNNQTMTHWRQSGSTQNQSQIFLSDW